MLCFPCPVGHRTTTSNLHGISRTGWKPARAANQTHQIARKAIAASLDPAKRSGSVVPQSIGFPGGDGDGAGGGRGERGISPPAADVFLNGYERSRAKEEVSRAGGRLGFSFLFVAWFRPACHSAAILTANTQCRTKICDE